MRIPSNFKDVKTSDSCISPEQNLLNAISELGMITDIKTVVADKEIHRFAILGSGRKSKNDDGYYWLDPDTGCGCLGDWKGEFPSVPIKPSGGRNSLATKTAQSMLTLASAEESREKQELAYEEATLRCKELWDSLEPADETFPYLVKKKLNFAYGARAYGDSIVIPFRNIDGKITTLQFINKDGDKRFLKDGKVKGSFATIGDGEVKFIVEGFATGASIFQETGLTTAVAGSASNLESVAEHFNAATIVADNDDAGISAAKKCNESYGNPVIVVPQLPDKEKGTDANDWMVAGENLAKLLSVSTIPERFYTLQDIFDNPTQTKSLLQGLLPCGPSTAMIFGPTGEGKTFVALDIGLSCAFGKSPWFGNLKIHEKTKVLYLFGEGKQSVEERILCWLQCNGISKENLGENFVLSPVSFSIDSPEALNEMLLQLNRKMGKYDLGLVIIDTLNLFMQGDENSTKDATTFVRAIKKLAEDYNCCVMVVHHTGLERIDRARGNSVFKASMDSEICVRRGADGIITVTQDKNKNSENVPPIHLQLETHELEGKIDEDTGELRRSAILVPAVPRGNIKEPRIEDENFLICACKKFGFKDAGKKYVLITRSKFIEFGKIYWKSKKPQDITRELNPNQKDRTLGRLLKNGLIKMTDKEDEYVVVDEDALNSILSYQTETTDPEELYA